MSYLLFVDESGVDRRESPYEVLAGVAIQDRKLWGLVRKLQVAEVECFGRRYTSGEAEAKGKSLLKRKTFRLAAQLAQFPPAERAVLARTCLEQGDSAGRKELAGLGQAKLAFVDRVFAICAEHGVCAFASIVPREAPRPAPGFLRKDYSYLFERFFYFLEDRSPAELGFVIFDELERSRCHLLVDQMTRYFQETATGRKRSARIIPEPFFVHSNLTTAIQIVDLVAYITSWGLKLPSMREARREELGQVAKQVLGLRHETRRSDRLVSSFKVIDDLRPLQEREGKEAWMALSQGIKKGKAGFPAKPPPSG
jgi:hypothetical protein